MASPAPAFIAYYRVSTDRQGASGLGLDAQRQAARYHAGSGQLIAEYTEIESGRRHTNRPQLLAALAECRKRRALIACDMPAANRLIRRCRYQKLLSSHGCVCCTSSSFGEGICAQR